MTSAPRFWWRPERTGAATVLWPASKLWGAAAAWRMDRPPRFRPTVPVVCIGNFVVGGAGKTPTCLTLARIARGRGLKPGFLTRGYGGSAKGPLLVDPKFHRADTVGDEALLLAASAPTVVGGDRVAGAKVLLAQGVELIVMDDGFQNPALAKDLSLVCVDAEVGIGNGMVTPSGPLRAPLAHQLRKADALIIIGEGERVEPLIRTAARAGRPVLRATLKPARVREWRKEPILAFAGIGRPEKFFASLAAVGAAVKRTVPFPDHHRFSEADAVALIARAEKDGLRLVTTEKDMARLAGAEGTLAKLREMASAFAVTLEFENPTAVAEMILAAARKGR
ncbi:MAG TPA: tetraacyldisaccharide 4'-kinase [Bauldia sp.]|nr:tetraacyldisaccharide 4'-kinase [Bauldia sp.]